MVRYLVKSVGICVRVMFLTVSVATAILALINMSTETNISRKVALCTRHGDGVYKCMNLITGVRVACCTCNKHAIPSHAATQPHNK